MAAFEKSSGGPSMGNHQRKRSASLMRTTVAGTLPGRVGDAVRLRKGRSLLKQLMTWRRGRRCAGQ